MKKEGKWKRLLDVTVPVLCLSVAVTGCEAFHFGQPAGTSDTTMAVTSIPITEETSESIPEETVDYAVLRTETCSLLIEEIYNKLTSRAMPDGAYADHAANLADGTSDIFEVVSLIIESPEFEDADLTDEEFAIGCYSAFEGKIASSSEIRFVEGLLEDGMSRGEVAQLFMKCEHFAETCSGYGFLPQYEMSVTAFGDDCYGYVNELTCGEHLTPVGDFIPGPEALDALYAAMDELDEQNRSFGYLMIDMETGYGVAYNIDQTYYTASSIKGPFAASFACQDPDSALNWESTIINMLVNSDNDAYTALNNTYRRVFIQQWCEEIGIDPEPFRFKYPHITTRQLTSLWLRSYEFFESGEFGEQAGTWFENPAYSLIHSELGEQYVTRSKAGWLIDDDPTHTTTVDAGIVYADNGPYVVVIMSRVPRDIEPLRPLMQAIEITHLEM